MSQDFIQLRPEDPEFIGGWKLVGRIGQGGFGTIYVGTKDRLTAAIKLISREAIEDQESIPRFANEVRSLKELNHPGIPKLIDHNLNKITPSISPFIAVEYFEGETFQSFVDQKKTIDEQLWLEYLKSLVEILTYCHEKGIIHRDISPSNIIITKDGPKLIDFGFSYLKGSERLSQKDVTVGTRPFRSPEHYAGEPIDAMDVFSLASVFVYIANGAYPFIAEQESRYVDKILYDAPAFQGMSENQKSLLTPLFYKDPGARPALNDIMQGIVELQSNKQLNTYSIFLKNKDKKLRLQRQNNLAKTNIARLLLIVFTAAISTVGLISLLSRQSAEASDCDRLFKDTRYEEAITACALEVSKGNQKFQITLGKAYKRANQIDQAKEVFAKCKDQYFECLHENAFFLEDANQARKDWKKAYENGVINSSWALAVSYNKSGETATANSWVDIAVAANNPIGKFMKSARAYADKDYKTSLEIAKSLIGEDISDYPGDIQKGLVIEKWILAIYDITKDEVGRKKFLEECATNNVYCIGVLSRFYLGKDNVKAKIWAEKGVALNDGESMWVMGRLSELKYWGTPEEKSADTTQARYWYKRAAELGDVSGMFRTADFADLDKRSDDACFWSNRLISKIDLRKGTWDERLADASWKETASEIIQRYKCGIPVEPVSSKSASSKQLPESSAQTKPTTCSNFSIRDNVEADVLRTCQALINSGDLNGYYNIGFYYYEQGEVKKAISWWQQGAEKKSALSMYRLAGILYENGEFSQAKKWYLACVESASTNGGKSWCMNGLGKIFYQENDMKQSRVWYQKSADLGDQEGYYRVGLNYANTKEWQQALNNYLKIKTPNIGTKTLIAHAYRELGDENQALIWYEKAAEDGSADALVNVGVIYYLRNDFSNSIKSWKKASELGSGVASYKLARLYDDQKKPEEAETYDKIGASQGEIGSIFFYAFALQSKADYKNAKIWYQKGVDKNDPQSMVQLGAILSAIDGDDIQACALWTKASSLGSSKAKDNVSKYCN